MADKASDYKKEDKEFYRPKVKPVLVDISMNFIMVYGSDDPNNNAEFEIPAITAGYKANKNDIASKVFKFKHPQFEEIDA